MARSSFGKRERERAKQAKAAAKRERQQGGGPALDDEPSLEAAPPVEETASEEDLLRKIEEVHQRYEAGTLSQDDFEAAKADLLGRLPVD